MDTPDRVGVHARTRSHRAPGRAAGAMPGLARAAVLATVGACGTSIAGPATLTFVESPIPGAASVEVVGLDAAGRALAANASVPGQASRAFRWSPASGGAASPSPMVASSISGDGRVILGSITSPSGASFSGSALRWRTDQIQGNPISTVVGPFAQTLWGRVVGSHDASVVLCNGLQQDAIGNFLRIARVLAIGLPVSPAQPVGDWNALGVSDDGQMIVGQSGPSTLFAGDPRLYRPYVRNLIGNLYWDIRAPGNEPADGEALAISGDATTVVGRLRAGSSADGRRAFVWSFTLGTRYLRGDGNDGFQGVPRALSHDGSVVAGEDLATSRALVWDGIEATPLLSRLVSDGADIAPGTRLIRVTGVGADGRSFAGDAALPSGRLVGFLATLGTPCVADQDDASGVGIPDGAVTIDDLLYFLAEFSRGGTRADLDDGSGTGTRDESATIEDLLYFLVRFDAGC